MKRDRNTFKKSNNGESEKRKNGTSKVTKYIKQRKTKQRYNNNNKNARKRERERKTYRQPDRRNDINTDRKKGTMHEIRQIDKSTYNNKKWRTKASIKKELNNIKTEKPDRQCRHTEIKDKTQDINTKLKKEQIHKDLKKYI